MIRRISLLVVVFVVSGGAALAQIHSIPTRTKPSIELKLSSATSMVCVGSSLPLDLELTNRGRNKFKVDKFDIKGDGGTDYVTVEPATGALLASRTITLSAG